MNTRGVPPTNTVLTGIRRHTAFKWVIPTLLCTLFITQLLLSTARLSVTCDEQTHIYAGYRALKCGDFEFSREHPPLSRIVAAVPLLAMDLAVNCSPVEQVPSFSWGNASATADSLGRSVAAIRWFFAQEWQTVLSRARIAVSVFAVGLCLLVWTTARRMFGAATAVIATVLLVFEPSVLANGALVMTDLAAAFTFLFAVFAFYLFVQNRTAPYLLLTGLATGLALLAKHSGVLLIPSLCLLAVADPHVQPNKKRLRRDVVLRNLLSVLVACVLAAGMIWGSYGMRVGQSGGQQYADESQQTAVGPSSTAVMSVIQKSHIADSHLLPLPYIQGLIEASALTSQTTPTVVLGRSYPHSPWFMVPLQLGTRLTAAFLLMISLALIASVQSFNHHRREFVFLLVPLIIYVCASMLAGRMGGIRHLLPILPLLLIIAAAGCVELARRVRWANYAVLCLILFHAASSLHAFPNYLSYSNEIWGGPTKTYKCLPYIDMGQGYMQAKAYLEAHPGKPCWLLTGWQWDPALYDLPCETLGDYLPKPIPPRMTGSVIVSSSLLSDGALSDGTLTVFKNTEPKDYIAGSALLVYNGDFDTTAAAGRSEYQLAFAMSVQGRPDVGLQLANDAVALLPNDPATHLARCELLAENRQFQPALAECETVIVLAKGGQQEAEYVEIAKKKIESITTVKTSAYDGGRP